MTQPKTFTVKRSSKQSIPFNIELEQEDGPSKTVTFHLKPKVPGTLVLDLVASGSLEPAWQAAALRQFLTEALVEDERDDFFKTLETSTPPIDLTDLTSMTSWFVEQYGENPTQSATQ